MKQKFFLMILFLTCLSGCSFFVYTPVVISSSLGLNKTDLSENAEYKTIIEKPYSLKMTEGKNWKLKKFTGGRYHIELESDIQNKTNICDLNTGSLIIHELFNDTINGGTFFNATVFCNNKQYSAPLNSWSVSFKNALQIIEN